jgi:hypothetical protein
MRCRGQINSEEEEWTDTFFQAMEDIREFYEYRLKQKKKLNNAISYYTKQFKHYQSSNQDDPTVQLNIAFLYQHGYGVKNASNGLLITIQKQLNKAILRHSKTLVISIRNIRK